MTSTVLVQSLQDRVVAHHDVVAAQVRTTPLDAFVAASERLSAEVLLKCEHLQHTGSFKVRGATAKLAALGAESRRRGVVAASSGNHGLGVAFGLAALGGEGVVFVPVGASEVKVAAIRRFGVEVRHVGALMDETEVAARTYARSSGRDYISPYNDIDVMAGQGSIGLEIAGQLTGIGDPDVVIAAVGGGGLVAGLAAAIKLRFPAVQVIGASPANDAAMVASVRSGRIVSVLTAPTLSDGTAGGLEPDTLTLPLCAELVDDWVLVSEGEIAAALRLVIDTQHQLIEGAAAVAVAAALQDRSRFAGKRVVIVSCGANISSDALSRALAL